MKYYRFTDTRSYDEDLEPKIYAVDENTGVITEVTDVPAGAEVTDVSEQSHVRTGQYVKFESTGPQGMGNPQYFEITDQGLVPLGNNDVRVNPEKFENVDQSKVPVQTVRSGSLQDSGLSLGGTKAPVEGIPLGGAAHVEGGQITPAAGEMLPSGEIAQGPAPQPGTDATGAPLGGAPGGVTAPGTQGPQLQEGLPSVDESVSEPIGAGTLEDTPESGLQPPPQVQPYPVSQIEPPQQQEVELTPSQQQAQDMVGQLQDLYTAAGTKESYRIEQEQKFGVDESQRSIMDLTSQLTALKAEYDAIPLQLEEGAAGRGVTSGLLATQTYAQQRRLAVQALTLQALLAGAQGQLSMAQYSVDQAVRQKYAQTEADIETLRNNLNLIMSSPQYSAEEKAQAQYQAQLLEQKQYQLNLQRAKDEQVYNIAVNAASGVTNFKPSAQYPTATVALNAIQNAPDPVTAARIAAETGMYGVEKEAEVTYTQRVEEGALVQYATDPKTGAINPNSRTVLREAPAEEAQYSNATWEGNELVQYRIDPTTGQVDRNSRTVIRTKEEEETPTQYTNPTIEGNEEVQYGVDPETGLIDPANRQVIRTLPEEEVESSRFTQNQLNQLAQAGLENATEQEKLDYLYGTPEEQYQAVTPPPEFPSSLMTKAGNKMDIEMILAHPDWYTSEQVATARKYKADLVAYEGTGGTTGGGFSDFTPQEQRELEQAGLQNASYQKQLNYLYGDKPSEPKTTSLSPSQRSMLISTGFTDSEINQLERDVSQYGLEAVLGSGSGLSESQKQSVRNAYSGGGNSGDGLLWDDIGT